MNDNKSYLNDIDSFVENEIELYNKIGSDPEDNTFGNKLSDKIAVFGGSWRFIIIFISCISIWIVINSLILVNAYDPYPFILLNLILSCLAAIQAPIIMMSQNRQEKRDRLQIRADYRVNLKAELEVKNIQNQIDQLSKLTEENNRILTELAEKR